MLTLWQAVFVNVTIALGTFFAGYYMGRYRSILGLVSKFENLTQGHMDEIVRHAEAVKKTIEEENDPSEEV